MSDPSGPQCDCGYRCQGVTAEERVLDAQRHAREAHGIDVSSDQVLAVDGPEGPPGSDEGGQAWA